MNIRYPFEGPSRAALLKWAGGAAKLIFGCLLVAGGLRLLAQGRPGDDRESDGPGVGAGGKWTEYSAEDRMTAAKRVRFELPADNSPDSDQQARIVLYCTDGRLNLADFRPNIRLSRPNWPGFWGQPQMHVRVRADNQHSSHNWNWVNGHFLSMDKGSTRELIGARLFRVEFQTPDGPQIAEFSPAGLDANRVDKACGLKSKRP